MDLRRALEAASRKYPFAQHHHSACCEVVKFYGRITFTVTGKGLHLTLYAPNPREAPGSIEDAKPCQAQPTGHGGWYWLAE